MQSDLPSTDAHSRPLEPLPAWRRSTLAKILLGIVFVLGIAAMYPIGGAQGDVAPEGSVWNGVDIVADFSFPIYRDEAAYHAEVDSVLRAVPPVFAVDSRADDSSVARVDLVLAAVHSTQTEPLVSLAGPLTAARAATLRQADVAAARRQAADFLQDAYRRGVINVRKTMLKSGAIVARRTHEERVLSADSVYDLEELTVRLHVALQHASLAPVLRNLVEAAVAACCVPDLLYDSLSTEVDRRAAADAVPRTAGIVARGERIVARGQRVDAATLERLNSYLAAHTLRGEEHTLQRYCAAVVTVLLIVLLVLFYLVTLRRRLLGDTQQLVIFAVIIGFEALLAFISMRFGDNVPMEYLVVAPTAAMLGTILFDSRTGFFFAVVVALIVAGIRGNDFIVALGALIAGGFAAYTVRDIRSRTQLFKSIGYIFLGYALTIVAAAFERATPPLRLTQEGSFALLNAVVSPVLTYALLIVFERTFHLTSDLTLLEFDNINHPLLKELSTAAPGTFHHTMVIADMAERAANAIGANAILAKVGAYYHDIGKIANPELFVENQLGIRNRHERLSPLNSARIIMQHVPDGLALAEKYHVPQKIADFIPMHHGTTMIAYFYDRALRRRKREEVREEDFRYAGPRPHSKETAIVMLADSVEATIRSVGALDEAGIEKMVERTMRGRFLEGQLDECELTAADLAVIRDQFVEILIGIHHPRIKYPESGSPSALDEPALAMEQTMEADAPDVPPPTEMPDEQRDLDGDSI